MAVKTLLVRSRERSGEGEERKEETRAKEARRSESDNERD